MQVHTFPVKCIFLKEVSVQVLCRAEHMLREAWGIGLPLMVWLQKIGVHRT